MSLLEKEKQRIQHVSRTVYTLHIYIYTVILGVYLHMYALGGIGYCGQHLSILQYKVLLHVLMCTVEEGLGEG